MRRILRAAPVFVLVCALVAVAATPVAGQRRAPDLTVASSAEPPDFARRGSSFQLYFTVDNQGAGSARRRTITRAYLAVRRFGRIGRRGRVPRRVGARRVGARRVRGLRSGRSTTSRMTIRVRRNFPPGVYFLVLCADVRDQVNETNDRSNCHVAGQRVRVGDQEETGPPGPQGPPGDARTLVIPRTTLSLGTFTIAGKPGYGPGDNEGSTQQTDLLEVGGVRIRALCRASTNGDNELPEDDDDADGFLGVDNDFNTDEDGDEAKILLYLDRSEGNFSFSGPHGKRFNINAGFGNTTTSIEDPNDDDGGEGKHMAIATAADPESRIRGDADDTNPAVGEDPNFNPEDDWEQAFRHGTVYVATSSGTEFVLTAYAGVGVVGAQRDQCSFGGTVTVVSG